MSIPTTLNITSAQHPINAAKPETFENRPVKAHDVLSGIQEQLTAQIQKSSNESQREILEHIRTVLLENPADILSKDDLEEIKHSAATPQVIDKFSIKIKQSMLNALNHEIVTHIESTAPTDKAKHILRNALAESRLSALKEVKERTPNNSFIKTCLSEHIAAAVLQKEVAQQHLLKIQLNDTRDKFHDILTEAESHLALRREELERIVSAEKLNIEKHFHSIISRLVDSNKAELAQQYKLSEVETNNRCDEIQLREKSIQQLRDDYEDQDANLTAISNAINKGDFLNLSKINTTPILKEKIQEHIKLHENKKVCSHELKQSELELFSIKNTINPAYISDVKILQDRININNDKIASEKSKLLQTQKNQKNQNWIVNTAIKISKLLGGSKNKKIKGEYNSEIKKIQNNINKLESEQTKINKELAKGLHFISETELQIKSKREKVESDIHDKQQNLATLNVSCNESVNKINMLISSEKEKALDALNIQVKILWDNFWDRREKIVSNEEFIEDRISLLEKENNQLKQMLSSNHLDNTIYSFLERRLEGNNKSIEMKEMYTAWENLQNETSHHHQAFNSDANEIKNIRNEWLEANSKVEQGLQVDFSSTLEKAASVMNKYNITFGEKKDNYNDIQIELEQAASLYSMLCLEKLSMHKIDSIVNKASLVVPEVLELVKKLEDEINELDTLTINTLTRVNQKSTLDRNKENIIQKLTILKKIANQNHEQFLNISKDFSEQTYSSKYNVYVDRQKGHGTCMMHTWNNLISYLTNNSHLQLTPYRTEKIIHGKLLLSAKNSLGEITKTTKRNNTDRRLKEIDQVLLNIFNNAELISNIYNSKLATNGHAMTFRDDDPSKIAKTHLSVISTAVFDMASIRTEKHCHVFNIYSQQQDVETNLFDLHSSKCDAYQITFQSDKGRGAHALALVKHNEGYLLIDSNHEEPVPIKIEDLVNFFTNKKKLPEYLDNVFIARNYSIYDNLIIRDGYFKEGSTYGN
ncbi:hypothetical protein CF635_003556 [Enterobacter hormaechei]|nr:hypothetical protein [Enterobacter hormaechei]